MTKRINGFASFDDFQRDTFYTEKIEAVTEIFNSNCVFLSQEYVEYESDSFWENTDIAKIRGQTASLHKEINTAYDEILLLYLSDTQITPTPCYFRDGPKEGQQLSNCQLNQLYAITSTTVDALKLSNTVKVYLGIFVLRDRVLTRRFIQIVVELQRWPIVEGETLESQLRREMALIDNPHLKGVFSEALTELLPILEKRLREYENCAPFGSPKCMVCGATFKNKVLAPVPLPNAENKTEVRQRFHAIFREVFYQSINNWLNRFLLP